MRALVRHISRVFGCAVRTYFRLYSWVHAHAVVGTAPVGAGTHVLRQLPPRRPQGRRGNSQSEEYRHS